MSEVVSLPYQDAANLPSPHSLESERAVLGCILLSPACVWLAIEELTEEAFYKEAHKVIFRGLLACTEEYGTVDLMLLTETLRTMEQLKAAGGVEYISKLGHSGAVVGNFKPHMHILQKKQALRELGAMAKEIAALSHHPSADFVEIAESIEAAMLKFDAKKSGGECLSVREIAETVIADAEAKAKQPMSMCGIETGFAEVDRMLVGMMPGDLVVFAGRPAMGKTAFGVKVALNVARRGQPTGVVSLEMSKEALTMRILCSEAKVDIQRFRRGQLSTLEWAAILKAANELARIPLYIDDTSSRLDSMGMRAKFKRMRQELGIEVGLLDYLQLMQEPGVKDNRNQEISIITRTMKLTAKEVGIPIIALCQLSRAVESRKNRRPILSDLRESGSIEQDADVVGFLYREAYYLRQDGKTPTKEQSGRAELDIAKQRNGPTGRVFLAFEEAYARYDSLPPRIT